MKRMVIGLLTAFMLVSLCACGHKRKDEDGEVTVQIQNRVVDRITALAASWSIDGNTFGTTGIEIADDEECLGDAFFSSVIRSEDVKSEKDLQKLEMTISVTEQDGGTFDVVTISLPSEYGDQYEIELRFEDGSYSVWQAFENNIDARLVNERGTYQDQGLKTE